MTAIRAVPTTNTGARFHRSPSATCARTGICSVDAFCEETGCGHASTLNVDSLPDGLPVPDVSLRLRCRRCGGKAIHTRPNWSEMRAAGMGRDA